MPSRAALLVTKLRLRTPPPNAMRSVTLKGKNWTDFDPAQETIRLPQARGTTTLTIYY